MGEDSHRISEGSRNEAAPWDANIYVICREDKPCYLLQAATPDDKYRELQSIHATLYLTPNLIRRSSRRHRLSSNRLTEGVPMLNPIRRFTLRVAYTACNSRRTQVAMVGEYLLQFITIDLPRIANRKKSQRRWRLSYARVYQLESQIRERQECIRQWSVIETIEHEYAGLCSKSRFCIV